MDSPNELQVFVRNANGQVLGPVTLPSVGSMFERGVLEPPVQVSQDGVLFKPPAEWPEFRDAFPKELLDFRPPPKTEAAPQPTAPAAAPAAPMAGPGAMAAASARAVRSGGKPINFAPAAPGTAPSGAAANPPGASTATAPARSAAPPLSTAPEPAAPPPAPVAPLDDKAPPPAAGSLADSSPIHLYYLAASSEQTGLLTITLSDRSISIHFRKGNPEHVSSTHPEDSLAQFLKNQSLASAEQIAKAEAAAGQFGGDLTASLFGLGILNPGTAFAQLLSRATSLIQKAMAATSGQFTYVLEELPASKVMPLGNRWGVLSEQVRRIPVSEMRRRLQADLDLPLMKSGGRIQATELRLTPQETRALAMVDGLRSLNRLAQELPAEADTFFRLAFYLGELELLSFAAMRQAGAAKPPDAAPPQAQPVVPPAPPAAKPAPAPAPAVAKPAPTTSPSASPPVVKASAPAPVAKPAPTVARPSALEVAEPDLSTEQELVALRERAEKLQNQNLFEVLGVSEKTDSATVKASYFKLAKRFHPDTVKADDPEELGLLKEVVFAKIGEAYRRLGDDKARVQYVEELKSGGTADIDVVRILQAEELFQKGCVLVKVKRFDDAVKMFEEAVASNQDEPEFHAWLGYARYFAATDKAEGLKEATRLIQKCLQTNERVAQAHYLLGHVTKLAGDATSAMKHFKRTLELRPDHVEAQREVRLAGKK